MQLIVELIHMLLQPRLLRLYLRREAAQHPAAPAVLLRNLINMGLHKPLNRIVQIVEMLPRPPGLEGVAAGNRRADVLVVLVEVPREVCDASPSTQHRALSKAVAGRTCAVGWRAAAVASAALAALTVALLEVR